MATDYMYGDRDRLDRGVWSDMNRWGTSGRGFDKTRQYGTTDYGRYGREGDVSGEFDRGYEDWTRSGDWDKSRGYSDLRRRDWDYGRSRGDVGFERYNMGYPRGYGMGGFPSGGYTGYTGGYSGMPMGGYGGMPISGGYGGMTGYGGGFPGFGEVDWNTVFSKYPSTWSQREQCYLPMFGESASNYELMKGGYGMGGYGTRGFSGFGGGWDRGFGASRYPGDLAMSQGQWGGSQWGRMGAMGMGGMGPMGMSQMGGMGPMGMGGMGMGRKMWRPRCDIIDGQNILTLEFELPGVSKDHINLSVGDNYIILQSLQDLKFPERAGPLFQNERHFGNFYRRVELPCNVDANQSQAVLEHGILRITLPKKNIGISTMGASTGVPTTLGGQSGSMMGGMGTMGGTQIPPGYKMSKKGILKPIKEKKLQTTSM